MSARSIGLVGLVVASSGFSSLVYQVVWERTVRFNFGGDSVSSAVVTATFLLGLGVGAVVFGRWFDEPFRLLALVEAAIGLYAMASYYVLAPIALVLGRLFGGSIADVEGLRPAVVVGCILFLLPGCVLIGGTLPLMFNCFIRPAAYDSRTVGALYGLNTAGAALGALAAPFVFLNRLSIPATLAVVGAGNLLIAVAAWRLGRGPAAATPEPAATPAGEAAAEVPLGGLAALAFASGFIALAFEVVLFRVYSVLNPSSPYNFPAILVFFLLAMAAGSALFTRFRAYSTGAALRRMGALFLLTTIALLTSVLARRALAVPSIQFALPPFDTLGYYVLHAALLVVPAPLLLSGVFPLLLRVAAPTGRRLPARTGLLYATNSVGAFSGALLSQFYGFSLLGTKGVIIGLVLAGVLAGGWCLRKADPRARSTLRWAVAAAGLAIAPFLVPRDAWEVYRSGVAERRNVDRVEGVTGVAVIKWNPAGEVFVNGQIMSALPDHRNHVRLVSFALALPRRQHVLLLGLGGGGMVRELVRDPDVRRVDIVDWSYELPRLLATPRARDLLDGALDHPKVRIWRSDARVAVALYEPHSFDIVIDNLALPYWVGATSVKSITYFRRVHRVLKPFGVFIAANYDAAGARAAILSGLTRTFQVVQVHRQAGVALSSDEPIEIDPERAEQVLQWRGDVIGIREVPRSEWLVAGFRRIPAEELRDVSPVRDELLIYEYNRDPFRFLFR